MTKPTPRLRLDGAPLKPAPAPAPAPSMPRKCTTADDIAAECDALREMLLEKNRAYGDSALDPLRVFSKADPVEQILVRIDDKLSRLKRGSAAGEDVEQDLLGYLILLRIARKRHATPAP